MDVIIPANEDRGRIAVCNGDGEICAAYASCFCFGAAHCPCAGACFINFG